MFSWLLGFFEHLAEDRGEDDLGDPFLKATVGPMCIDGIKCIEKILVYIQTQQVRLLMSSLTVRKNAPRFS